MQRRVAVVGAGYAGMAAAVALAAGGMPVTVFESGPVPGGRARRVLTEAKTLDNGQHILIGAYTSLLQLMRQVGVPRDAMLRLPLDLRYADGFRLHARRLPWRAGLLAGLLFARGVPLAERLSAARFMASLQASGFAAEEGLTVEKLLERHAQRGRLVHYLWGPLCVSALNTPPGQASARAFLVVLRDALCGEAGASDLLLPRRDLSKLFPEPAAEFVRAHGGEVRFGDPVRSLEALRQEFAAIIVAVGPHQLKPLFGEDAPRFSYQPIFTCYLQYPERVGLPFPMLGLAEGLVQWVFDRGALMGELGRLACVISAQGDHQQMSLDELAGRCHEELARVLPHLPAPSWTRVIAEKRATVACLAGSRNALDSMEKKFIQKKQGSEVLLAGDYTDPEYPPTLEAAVRSGLRAAEQALRAAPA